MPALAPDLELRRCLLEYFLEIATSQELSNWLRDINQDPRGSVAEKQDRIRQNTHYLSMAPEEFPQQTESYLQPFTSEHLAEICEDLGIDASGGRDHRYRRLMREVRFREGWVTRPATHQITEWNVALVKPFIAMYPILKRGQYERDFYGAFQEEMTEIFGVTHVHPQLAIAYGTTLKIDFHIGPVAGTGVGVEMKMPTSNSELQRAIGQVDQYRDRYGSNLVLLLLADFLNEAQKQLFLTAARSRGVEVLER